MSTSYTAVVTLGASIPTGDAGSIILNGITEAATAQEAAEKALLAAKAAAELARNAHNAADVAAGATPLDDIRRTLSRLYLVLLGRVPDTGGMDFYTPAKPYTDEQWAGIALAFMNSTEAGGTLGAWRALSNRAFVEKLYTNALGALPTGAAGLKELNEFVTRLDGGAARDMIAFEIANGMLAAQNQAPGDRAVNA